MEAGGGVGVAAGTRPGVGGGGDFGGRESDGWGSRQTIFSVGGLEPVSLEAQLTPPVAAAAMWKIDRPVARDRIRLDGVASLIFGGSGATWGAAGWRIWAFDIIRIPQELLTIG